MSSFERPIVVLLLVAILLPFYLDNYAIAQKITSRLAFADMQTEGDLLPGKIFSITATITNPTKKIAFDAFVTISAPEAFEILGSPSRSLDLIYPDDEKTAKWDVRAQSAGTFNLVVTYHSSNLGSESFTFPVNIMNVFMGSGLAPVTTFWGSDPSDFFKVLPGDTTVPLGIILVNRGNLVAYNVTGTLLLHHPFYWSYQEESEAVKLFSQTSYAGPIPSNQNATLRFFLDIDPLSRPGMYPNTLMITYTDGREFVKESYEVTLPVYEVPSISVKVQHSEGFPGDTMWLNFTLTNTGNSVHGLTVSMENDSTLTPLNTPVILDTLNEGESKLASFLVYINREAFASEHPVKIDLSYIRGGNSINETRVVGTKILGESLFALGDVRAEPETIYPGDKGNKLTINIINDGHAMSENVRATLHVEKEFEASWGGADSFFLGRLMPGENRSAVFFVDISKGVQSGAHPIKLEVVSGSSTAIFDVPIIVSPRAKFEVTRVQDSGLYPGASAVSLRITINNNGSSTAESVTAKLLGGNKLLSTTGNSGTTIGNTELLGMINPNQSAEVSFLVNVDPYLAPGNHTFTLEISWREGSDKSFTDTAAVAMNLLPGAPSLLIYAGIPWLYFIIGGITASLLGFYVHLRVKKQQTIDRS